MTATVKRGTTCRFSSKPALAKLPATLNCAGGKASKRIWLPGNDSTSRLTYHFGLSVTGPGGATKAKPATVTVPPEAPSLSALAASPASLPSSGGQATVSGRVMLATSCSLSARPALAGQPFAFKCPAGATARPFSKVVTLPALKGSAAVRYTFTVTATGPGGSVKSAAKAEVYPPLSFSAPVSIDQPAGGLDSMSCASAAFCQTIDRYGNVSSFGGSSWTPPSPLLPLPSGQVRGMTTAISCSSASFCAAIDSAGSFATLTGSGWSAPAPAGLNATAISCASSDFCVAVGGTWAAAYTGSWSAPAQLGANSSLSLVAVSCPDTSFCLAVSADGEAFTYDGSTWTPTSQFDGSDDDAASVSCHSAILCVAVDHGGKASVYNGTSWSSLTSVVGSESAGLDGVSCVATAQYCLATTSTGVVYSYNGRSWSAPDRVAGSALSAVSCTSATACAIDAGSGYVWREAGANWFSYHLEQQHGFLTSVSCPTTSFCAAVDQFGYAVLYNGRSWTVPQPVESGVALIAVSCPNSSFCMAIDAGGDPADGSDYYVYSGGTWGIGGFVHADLSSLACTSRTFCAGITSKGSKLYAETWNGSAWSAPDLLDSRSKPVTGEVSCASKKFCIAVDSAGNFDLFDGINWSNPTAVNGEAGGFAALSCPAYEDCTAVDGSGDAFGLHGAPAWSAPVTADSTAGVTGISCLTSGFCAAVDSSGDIATDYTGTWSTTDSADAGAAQPYGFTSIACPVLYFCAAVDYDGNLITGTN